MSVQAASGNAEAKGSTSKRLAGAIKASPNSCAWTNFASGNAAEIWSGEGSEESAEGNPGSLNTTTDGVCAVENENGLSTISSRIADNQALLISTFAAREN